MPISVKNTTGNTSPDQMLTQFNRKCQRLIKVLRRTQAFKRNDSFLKVKTGALIREKYRAERAKRKYYI